MVSFGQNWFELGASPCVSASRKRSNRVSVITLTTSNYMPSLRFANLHKILSRHFERCLNSFRATRN